MFRHYLGKIFVISFYTSLLITIIILTGFIVRNIHHPKFAFLKDPVIFIVDLPIEIYNEFFLGLETEHPKQPQSVINQTFNSKIIDANLIYQFQGNIYKNGKIAKNLPYNKFSFYLNDHQNYFLTINENNSIISKYKFENKQVELLWNLPFTYWHHEIHVDDEGYIYSPIYFPINEENGNISDTVKKLEKILSNDNSPAYGITKDNYRDDGVIIVSPNGKIIHKLSLTDLFEKNGILNLIYGSGLETDPFHLNSVYPSKLDKGIVKKGDLLLSLRHLSMLLIYRPENEKIIWYKQGEWSNQHSAKFDDNGDIYLFDNNLIETHYQRRREQGFIDGNNRILVHDIEKDKTFELDTCIKNNTDLNTVTGGEVKIVDRTMYARFNNIDTKIICNLETKEMTYLNPKIDKNNMVIPKTGYTILYLGR